MGQWTRQLRVIVPVEEPKRWTDLSDALRAFSEFVTQDSWQFEFATSPKRWKTQISRPTMNNASVNLLSGGLDSLCGAAAAFRRREAPVFVTHSPPSLSTARNTIDVLKERIGFADVTTHFANFRFQATDKDASGRRNMFPERSRRTRPFLFLSMAGAIALELKIPKLYLNENGVLATNLPFQPNLHGPLISRHAHPETLRRFEVLLKQLWPFETAPSVSNPFFRQTKGEELATLHEALELANCTVSCEYSGQQVSFLIHWLKQKRRQWRGARECGLCYPCLVRRVALHHAGVPEDVGHYVFDARVALRTPEIYADFPLFNHIRFYVRDLQDFCFQIKAMTPSRFVVSYMPEISCVSKSDSEVSGTASEIYDLYTRFASEVVRYFNQ